MKNVLALPFLAGSLSRRVISIVFFVAVLLTAAAHSQTASAQAQDPAEMGVYGRYVPLVESLVPVIEQLTGRSKPMPIRVWWPDAFHDSNPISGFLSDLKLRDFVAERRSSAGLAETHVLVRGRANIWGDEYTWPASYAENRVCWIFVSDGGLNERNDIELRGAVAHEIYHCFQRREPVNPDDPIPFIQQWFIEGSAAFVGELISGGTPRYGQGWLDGYHTRERRRMPLRERSYDAFVIFTHLHLAGADMPAVFERMLDAEPESRFDTMIANVPPRILARWPTGVTRELRFGPDWGLNVFPNALLYDVPPWEWPVPQPVSPGPGTQVIDIEIQKDRPAYAVLQLPAGELKRLRIRNAVGAVQVLDNGAGQPRTLWLEGGTFTANFCTGGHCRCGEAPPETQDVLTQDGILYLALLPYQGEVEIEVLPEASAALEPPPACCTGGHCRIDPRMVGTWRADNASIVATWRNQIDQASGGVLLPDPPGYRTVTGALDVRIGPGVTFDQLYTDLTYRLDPNLASTGALGGYQLTYNGRACGCLALESAQTEARETTVTLVSKYLGKEVFATKAVALDGKGGEKIIEHVHMKPGFGRHTKWTVGDGDGRIKVVFVSDDEMEIGLVIEGKPPQPILFRRVEVKR